VQRRGAARQRDDVTNAEMLGELPHRDDEVAVSSCYPAIHEFSVYEDAGLGPLPQSELVARSELTLPLFPGLAEEDQDRVIAALGEGLSQLG
jgi:dTDP-4-amino-4,6-dideoxygalactose transaminase